MYSNSNTLQHVGSMPGGDNTSLLLQDNLEDDAQALLIQNGGAEAHPTGQHPPAGTTVWRALCSLVCACAGAGIISLPGALRGMGWLGLVVLLLVALMAIFSAKLLVQCQTMTGERLSSYEAIGMAVHGRVGYLLVITLQNVTLLGVNTVFLIIIGENMNHLVPCLSLHEWVLVFGLAVLPPSCLKSFHEISFLAVVGALASLVAGGIIMAQGVMSGLSRSDIASASSPAPRPSYTLLGSAASFSLGFNVLVFSFGFHSILPALADSMQNIQHFPWVANIALCLIGVFYSLVASLGYWGYGDDTQDNILNNFSTGSISVSVALIAIVLHTTLAYPIVQQPVAKSIQRALAIDRLEGRAELLARLPVRTVLVFSTVLLASVVPYLGDMIGLISALSVSAASFVLPPWFYLSLSRRGNRPVSFLRYVFCVCNMLVGLLGSVLGLFYGVQALVVDIRDVGNPFSNYF
eukprot:g50957.t1